MQAERKNASTIIFLETLVRPSDQGFKTLEKDPDLQFSIEQYHQDLIQFLNQPEVLRDGDEILGTQSRLDQLKEVHQRENAAFSINVANLSRQHTNLTNSRDQLRRRIATIGKRPVIEGDKELMQGRLQVALWEARGKNRLSWQGQVIGWVLDRFGIDPQKVHPAIAQIDNDQLQLQQKMGGLEKSKQEKVGSLEEGRWIVSLGRMREEVRQKGIDWATKSWDRCLVHAAGQDGPELRYALLSRFREINPDDYPTLLGKMRFFGLLPMKVGELSDAAMPTTAGLSEEQIKPGEGEPPTMHPLLLHRKGREIMVTQQDQVQSALKEVLNRFRNEQRFEWLLADLLNLAMAEKPLDLPQVKKLAGGSRVYQGVGGEYVFTNKNRRIIFSISYGEEGIVIDVGSVGYRNEGTYGRWD